jgi:hypothetical protein
MSSNFFIILPGSSENLEGEGEGEGLLLTLALTHPHPQEFLAMYYCKSDPVLNQQSTKYHQLTLLIQN